MLEGIDGIALLRCFHLPDHDVDESPWALGAFDLQQVILQQDASARHPEYGFILDWWLAGIDRREAEAAASV